MIVQTLVDNHLFTPLVIGDTSRTVTSSFCCDLLSIAMSKAKANCAWVTVMGNINTIAVASLADVACIILAEDVNLDETSIKKATENNITVFHTSESIFDAALKIHELIHS